MEKNNLPCNLTFIKLNFGFLPEYIKRSEKNGSKLSDSLKVVEDAKNKIGDLHCAKGKIIVNKLNDDVLTKYPGYKALLKISKILSGEVEDIEGLPEDFTNDDLIYFQYAPISSVDVKRKFSVYKNLLSSNRRRFTFENIRKNLII